MTPPDTVLPGLVCLYWATMQAWLDSLLALLALPQYGLGTLFVVSFISATLLPLGSEPALFGLLKLNPELFWPAIAVATLGNTLGGALDWWMGYGAHRVADHYHRSPHHLRVLGWLRLPFWPCVGWMLVGKGLRYVAMTTVLMKLFPG